MARKSASAAIKQARGQDTFFSPLPEHAGLLARKMVRKSRVGTGRPLLDRPCPPLANRACTFRRTRLSPSPGDLSTRFSGQLQHTPLTLPAFSQVPLAHFLPHMAGFEAVTCSYPHVGTPTRVCTC